MIVAQPRQERRFGRACAIVQTRQSLCDSHIPHAADTDVDGESSQNL